MAIMPKLKLRNPCGREAYNYRVISMDLMGPFLTTLYYKGQFNKCQKCKTSITNIDEPVKEQIKINKTWVLVLTCLYSKHVSLQPLLENHSTETFLSALQKIFNRHGRPDLVISDAAGEFSTGMKHVQKLSEHLQNINLKFKLAQEPINIRFHMTTYSPWYNY